MNILLLIDGNAVMHRAYHALPPFKTKEGFPTHVIFGFFSILQKSLIDFQPTHLIVCFDVAAPTFRKKMFKEYKATRKKLENDFIVQIPVIKEGLDKAKIKYFEKPGFEADDIIGTICRLLYHEENRILVLSGDKDILQLANDKVKVITPQIGFSKMKIYGREDVMAAFQVTPEQMADYKALVGDQSDNYAGAKGIGPKTAALLINEFLSIENLYKNINKVKSDKIKKILEEDKETILMAKKLATIDEHVEIDFKVDETKFDQFPETFKDFLVKYEIYSLIKRFFKETKPVIKVKPTPKKSSPPQPGLF
jgi:DNA polymerase I